MVLVALRAPLTTRICRLMAIRARRTFVRTACRRIRTSRKIWFAGSGSFAMRQANASAATRRANAPAPMIFARRERAITTNAVFRLPRPARTCPWGKRRVIAKCSNATEWGTSSRRCFKATSPLMAMRVRRTCAAPWACHRTRRRPSIHRASSVETTRAMAMGRAKNRSAKRARWVVNASARFASMATVAIVRVPRRANHAMCRAVLEHARTSPRARMMACALDRPCPAMLASVTRRTGKLARPIPIV